MTIRLNEEDLKALFANFNLLDDFVSVLQEFRAGINEDIKVQFEAKVNLITDTCEDCLHYNIRDLKCRLHEDIPNVKPSMCCKYFERGKE